MNTTEFITSIVLASPFLMHLGIALSVIHVTRQDRREGIK